MASDGDEAIDDHDLPGNEAVVVLSDVSKEKAKPKTPAAAAVKNDAPKLCSACHKELAGKHLQSHGTRKRGFVACTAAGRSKPAISEKAPSDRLAVQNVEKHPETPKGRRI